MAGNSRRDDARQLVNKSLVGMSDKAPLQRQYPRGSNEFVGYVRCELSKADRESFSAWRSSISDGDLLQSLARMVGEGKRVSVTWKDSEYVASATDLDPDSPSKGMVLTAFGKDAIGAAQALVYKHTVILEGEWEEPNSQAYDVR